MIHNEGFLRAIAEKPKDDSIRLVYADWIDEHGDPEYADFIRVQITLSQNADGKGDQPVSELARLRSRERSLLSRNQTRWLQPLRDLGARGRVYGEFSRGFVDEPVIDTAVFLERGDELFRASPVATLHLDKVGRQARRLSRSPLLAHVRRLTFEGANSITPKGLRSLLESEHLTKLESLHLWKVLLRDADLLDLAAIAVLPPLRRLSLSDMSITGATMPALVARFDQLNELALSYNKEFDPRRFADILSALNPTALRSLAFDTTRLATLGMRALAEAKRFTGLEEMWMRGCGFDAESLQALAEATHLIRMKILYLGWETLGEQGGIALAAWPGLRSLQTLNLDGSHILSGGAEALAHALSSGALTNLELRGNTIGDSGLHALIASNALASVSTLDLTDNAITAEGIRPLADSPRSRQLRHLDLDNNQIGDEGATILAESPHLRSLRWLTLGKNGVGQESSRRLVGQLPNLKIFCADGGFFSEENLEAMRAGLATGGSDDAINSAIESRLVQSMLDDPDDMKARDLYAQFLRDIQSPWYVVIWLQRPNQDAMTEAVERWQNWFESGRNYWLAPLLPWAQLFDDSESFDRGFLRKVHFPQPLPDEVAESLTRFPPLALLPLEVQRGHMTGEGAFQVFARRECLARMNRLDFRSISTRELRYVLESPHLPLLQSLSFGHCRLDDESAVLLAASPKLANLRHLDFGCGDVVTPEIRNRIGPEGLTALGNSHHLSRLRSFGLQGNTLGDASVEVLLSAPSLSRLTDLDLRSTGLSDAEVRQLVESPWAGSLRTLRLGGGEILGLTAIESLAKSVHLADLHELELSLSDEGADILASSWGFVNLRVLRVNAGVTDSGREVLQKRFGSQFRCEDRS